MVVVSDGELQQYEEENHFGCSSKLICSPNLLDLNLDMNSVVLIHISLYFVSV